MRRLTANSTTVARYSSAGSSVAAENSLNSTPVRSANTARITSETTSRKNAALRGVRVLGEICCHSCQPGNRRSRDIAQVSRTPVIMITSPQAKIEITTRISSRSPMNDPSTILITSAIGVLEAASLTGFLAAAVTASRNRKPEDPRGEHRLPHRARHDPLGFVGLLGEVGGRLEPDDRERAQQRAQQERPHVRGRPEPPVPVARDRALAEQVVQRQVPGDHAHDQQQHHQREHPGELDADREVVDPLRPPRRVRHQQRLHHQHHPGDDPRVRRGPRVMEQVRRDR